MYVTTWQTSVVCKPLLTGLEEVAGAGGELVVWTCAEVEELVSGLAEGEGGMFVVVVSGLEVYLVCGVGLGGVDFGVEVDVVSVVDFVVVV